MPDGESNRSTETRTQLRVAELEATLRAQTGAIADLQDLVLSNRQLIKELSGRINSSSQASSQAWSGVKAVFARVRVVEQKISGAEIRDAELAKHADKKDNRMLLNLGMVGTTAGFVQALIALVSLL